MKKNTIGKPLFAVLTLMFFLFNGFILSEAAANKKNIKAALDSGDIKIILEGVEDGDKLNIKVEKKTEAPLVVVIPEGKTEFKVGNQPTIIIAIATSQELQIDLSKTTTGVVQAPQSSINRIREGSIQLESAEGGMMYSYQNAIIGVKK